jgi:hypothetical protein
LAEPSEPNVTTNTSVVKWSAFVTATNIPTWSSSDCTISNEGVADPEPGAVGLYHYVSFCVVCDNHIRDHLSRPFFVETAQCLIATAVYGDPQHADVRQIRAWRDSHLRPGARGRPAMRLLAGAYRLLGPPVAGALSDHPRLASAARRVVFTPLASAIRRRARTP